MTEKIVTLDDISPVDFLGPENKNLKALSTAFPESKIISRGHEIKVQGVRKEILRICEILDSLIAHYHHFGRIEKRDIDHYLSGKVTEADPVSKQETIVHGVGGLIIRPKTANQAGLVKAAQENDMVFAVGPAGTGKTYISVALAVRALKNKEVRRIIITRPAVEAGENLGFLPGDLQEKIDPYLRPVYDALHDMIPAEKLQQYRESGVIEVAPLAYMRGRTLDKAFILLDEAQNTTPMQIKMFLTRMGPSSKMIVTGDRSQIDLPKNQDSGLIVTLEALHGIEGIGFAELDSDDVVRHKLVKEIIDAYKRFGEITRK